MGTSSIIKLVVGVCAVLVVNMHAILPVAAFGEERTIYDSRFMEGQRWKQDLKGDVHAWELFPANSRMQLKNTGGPNTHLRLDLDTMGEGKVGVDIEYGWLNEHRDLDGLMLAFRDQSGNTGLRISIRQRGDLETCTVVRFSPESESQLASLTETVAQPKPNRSPMFPSGRLNVEWTTEGEAMVRYHGQDVQWFQAEGFVPEQLIIRDSSKRGNALVIAALRVYSGDNPFSDVQRLGFPFGAIVVQGQSPNWAARLTWRDDHPRIATVRGQVKRDDDGEVRDVNATTQLLCGETWEPDLGLTGLSPGLYRFVGTLQVGSIEYPLNHHFAVLSAELASRPDDEIPPWFGVVPQLQRHPPEMTLPLCDFMYRIGVRHVRWLPVWSMLEPELGKYDWSLMDTHFNAFRLYGFGIMGCISYWGPAGADIVGKDGQRQARSPEGRAFWVDHYAEELFKRYGHYVKRWQVWNEPNAYWHEDPDKARGFARGFGTPSNYFDLFRRSYDAAKRVSPDIKVLTSFASANQMESIEMMAKMGLLDRFDGIVVHTYGDHADKMQRVRQWMDNHGHADKEIASGEVGRGGGIASVKGQQRQAAHVAEVFMSSAAIDNVFGIDWFVLASPRRPFGFSMIDWQGEPRLSAVAYHTTARLMTGATGGSSVTKGSIRMHVVERNGRTPLTGLWLVGNTRVLKVGVKQRGEQKPLAWNLMGRKRDLKLRDDTTWIELTEAPLLIEGDIEVVFPVEMKLLPAAGGALKVRWDSDRPLNDKGVLVVESTELQPKRHERPVNLLGNRTEVIVPFKGAEPGEIYTLRASWQSSTTGMSTLAEREVEFTQVPRVTKTQAVALRRPEGHPHWKMKEYSGRYPLSGPDDLSAEMALGWTDQYLVLWIEQVDDQWVPVSNHPWQEDGPQFSLDPRHQRSENAFYIEYNFGLRKNGSPLVFVIDKPHYNPQLIGKREDNKTYYRLLVPFNDFDVDPKVGMTMGASLIINENDGNRREGWLHWGEGIAESKNPSLYREFVLAPPISEEP